MEMKISSNFTISECYFFRIIVRHYNFFSLKFSSFFVDILFVNKLHFEVFICEIKCTI